jgi:hypothetical protein
LPKTTLITLIPELLLAYTVAPMYWQPPSSIAGYFSLTNNFFRPYIGDSVIKTILAVTIVVHVGESLLALRLARKHAGSFRIGVSTNTLTLLKKLILPSH